MKTYEKPELIALSLSGNNRLCGDCEGKTTLLCNHLNIAGSILKMLEIDPDDNGIDGIDEDDFATVFGAGDDCVKPVMVYCKFTGSDTVAWS